MSMILIAKALSMKTGSTIRKMILVKLADNASDTGECWPSYQHIADQCECSKSAVKQHIAALIAMGLVRKENRLGVKNGKGNTSNMYFLTLDAMAPESTPPVPPDDLPPESPDNPPVSSESTPPVPPDGTRTYHSTEPVNDPVTSGSAVADHPQQPPEKMNYQAVLDSYHELLPDMPQVKILTEDRKKKIRSFWKKFSFTEQRWRAYLKYIAEHCRWMLEDQPNGKGGFWRRKNLDYLITERCYVAVKEDRANDQ